MFGWDSQSLPAPVVFESLKGEVLFPIFITLLNPTACDLLHSNSFVSACLLMVALPIPQHAITPHFIGHPPLPHSNSCVHCLYSLYKPSCSTAHWVISLCGAGVKTPATQQGLLSYLPLRISQDTDTPPILFYVVGLFFIFLLGLNKSHQFEGIWQWSSWFLYFSLPSLNLIWCNLPHPLCPVKLTLHIFLSHQNRGWLGSLSTSTVELQGSGAPLRSKCRKTHLWFGEICTWKSNRFKH